MAAVGIFGAGAVGGYLGVCLASRGLPVVLLRRSARDGAALELAAISARGRARRPAAAPVVASDPVALRDCAVVVVAVKSRDTAEAARALARVLPATTPVLSCQNGLHNVDTLAGALGRERVRGAVITFNVRRDGDRFEQTSAGPVFLDASGSAALGDLTAALRQAGEKVNDTPHVSEYARGKLLLNLQNGVAAALGLTIADTLHSADARQCFRWCLREGLHLTQRAGLSARSPLPLPLALMPAALALPGPLVDLLSRVTTHLRPDAVSSTLQDLQSGRSTEIRELNGEICRIAGEVDGACPANAAVVEAVEELERQIAAGRTPGFLAPEELRQRVERGLADAR